MSSGSASTTGPGRPEVATWKARLTYSGMRRASSIWSTHLAWVPNMWRKSISCQASRPMSPRATWPTNTISGVESCRAVWMPMLALVAPGPRVTKQIPGSPVSLP